ncbi:MULTISPECIES: ABC transporter substrate-binding protein [Rhodococcus]|uniref:ABC transporter substrate-binding protein n=1 Tax=Rhodococcus jostii TaxID=132919 RepID=A0ABU4CH46_RHOJO|nr:MULTISPECIES: ABC transporter substrate-binding protein [Rhodococcus]MDI9951762.1 ABC transporter substrate-binding protein [Rhodococcus sp. IEGM 1305]MDV6282867.1 ABC transporter substrate-binding protein [Rhodococcus jostii]
MHGQLFRSTGLVTLAVAALVVAGCSRGESVGQTASAESFAEPVSVTNCDRTETFDAPPQRIVSMNDHVTEVLIEMGAGDRIVGTGYGDATPLPEFADAFAKIPKLAKEYPTREQILDLDPDLVVGGMRSAFDEKEGRSRESLGDQGIPTFLFSEYCGQGFPDIGLLRSDYQQLGEILGDPDRARAITDRVTSGLQAVRDEIAGAAPVPTFFYDSGEDVPLTIGGVGVGQLIADHAGAANLFAEGEKPYSKSTWEIIGERAPEAIVVLDYGTTSAQAKIDFLKSHPIMSTTPAVKAGRFVVVPLDDFFESPRLVRSVETIARALHPDDVGAR